MTAVTVPATVDVAAPAPWLVVGNYGNGNTGDEAILAGLLAGLPPSVRPCVVSRNPAAVTALHGVPAVGTLTPAAGMALLRSRCVVIGGGGMFGYGLPPLVALLPVVAIMARLLLRKEVRFAALGAYGDTPVVVRRLLQVASRLATEVTVRDAESAAVMAGGPAAGRPLTVVGDPAETLRVAPAAEVDAVLPPPLRTARPLVVSLKTTPDPAAVEPVLDAIGRALAAEQDVVLLCLSDQGDYGVGAACSDRVLSDRLNERWLGGRATVVGPGLHPAVAKGLVARARGVVAMRLHAQIFATACGTPLLGLPFEAKSRAWLAAQGAVAVEVDLVTAADVAAWLAAPERRGQEGSGAR